MLTQEFLDMENKLVRAKCPEDFFGTFEGEIKAGFPDFGTNHVKKFMETISRQRLGVLTDNEEDRRVRVKRIFAALITWALEKAFNNSYGDKNQYRIKLVFTVTKHGERLRFLLEGSSQYFRVFADHLSALEFEGYDRQDAVTVKRGEAPSLSGSVSYVGGQADTNLFQLNDETSSALRASDFNPGDKIEIDTVKYGSVEEFLIHLLRSVGGMPPWLQKKMRKALVENIHVTWPEFMGHLVRLTNDKDPNMTKEKRTFLLHG